MKVKYTNKEGKVETMIAKGAIMRMSENKVIIKFDGEILEFINPKPKEKNGQKGISKDHDR